MLDDDEVKALLKACGDGDAATRNRALIALLAGTGMRISEALGLEQADLDIKKRRAHVRNQKGGKEREVWIHPDAVAPMRAWLKARKDIGLGGRIFCSLQGAPLSASYVRRMLPELAKAAGIQKRVYADGLRHTFAARSYEAKVTVRSLQVQFGHENVAATVAYLERLGLHGGFSELDQAFA